MPYLSAEDILKRDSFRYEEMDVPEWGGTLRYRTISGADRDRWGAEYSKADATNNPEALVHFFAKLIALAACDAEGARIFTQEHVVVLNESQSGAVIQRVFSAIAKLNKIDTEAVKTEGKDSSAPGASGTTSDSAST